MRKSDHKMNDKDNQYESIYAPDRRNILKRMAIPESRAL
jgi:hypothetical protein